MASIGELAAGVGHEINNPLTIAIGTMSSLRKMYSDSGLVNEKIEKSFEEHAEAVWRIKTIVGGLKTLAREDSDHVNAVDVKEVVIKTIQFFGGLFEKDGIFIQCDVCDEDVLVPGAIGKTQQVLVNLLQNAKDAIEKRKDKQLKVSLRINHHRVQLRVSDNGTGIPLKSRNKIFEAFYTTKEIGKGTGMGLSISSTIVSEMKGDLILEKTSPMGSTFLVDLPMAVTETEKQDVKVRNPEEEWARGEFHLDGKILIVDDEDGVRDYMEMILEDLGAKNINQ